MSWRILFLIAGFFAASCDGGDPVVPARKIVPARPFVTSASTPKTPVEKPEPVLADPQACLDDLRERDPTVKIPETPDSAVAVTLASLAEMDETTLFKNILDLGDAVYGGKDCPYEGMAFRAPGTDGTYFEGELRRGDYRLFRAGKISQAELGRRLEIRRLETVESLKLKLKQARMANDHGYAMTLADQWLEKEPGNFTARLVRANSMLAKKDYADAAALYEEILVQAPRRMDVWFNLAFAKREAGKQAEAAAIYGQLLGEFDGFTERVVSRNDIYLHLADTLAAENRLDEASIALTQSGMPDTEPSVILRAAILRGKGKPAESRKLLEKFMASHPESGTARYDLVVACIDLKDKDGARQEFGRLKSLAPALAEELKFLPLFSGKPALNPGPTEGQP